MPGFLTGITKLKPGFFADIFSFKQNLEKISPKYTMIYFKKQFFFSDQYNKSERRSNLVILQLSSS